jgi:hypothetical protein
MRKLTAGSYQLSDITSEKESAGSVAAVVMISLKAKSCGLRAFSLLEASC